MTVASQPLNPMTVPLNTVSLIEASAGTGKTHTIASLYLRLLLKVGEETFHEPLSVEQILVVTFTRMATAELKTRIRERIIELKHLLENHLANLANPEITLQHCDDFQRQLILALPQDRESIKTAIMRLSLADQDFDLAAIFTIDGFCQRMLKRYAFQSGTSFDVNVLETDDEITLQARLAQEVWRENFYTLDEDMARFIQNIASTPAELSEQVATFVNKNLTIAEQPVNLEQLSWQNLKTQGLAVADSCYLEKITALQAYWREHRDELLALLQNNQALMAGYLKKDGAPNAYHAKWLPAMDDWAKGEPAAVPDCIKHYTQTEVLNKAQKKDLPGLSHDIFQHLEQANKALNEQKTSVADYKKNLVRFLFLRDLNAKMRDYKARHTDKSFDDLKRLMDEALHSENGAALVALIRRQYPFAMIDEFQDTDPQQYRIFDQIYLKNADPDDKNGSAFLMIGDPKQSIYKFRGADIFSYLRAAKNTQQKFTLQENWRSTAGLITMVNELFQQNEKDSTSPFLFDRINYEKVNVPKAHQDMQGLMLNDAVQAPLQIYLQESENATPEYSAEICAASIATWLNAGVQGQASLNGKPIQAKNIAVLVSNRTQADAVKKALRQRGVQSVYLSEQKNIFQTSVAQDLLYILRACLHPLMKQNILNMLSCGLMGYALGDIQHIKSNETAWENTVKRFLDYQQIWQRQGILPMLSELITGENLLERVFQQADGERDLTDYLHLSELLQQASTQHDSQAALVSWLEKSIVDGANRQSAETTALRLESDRELVKIITIHKSKGLAFDLVWLPFAAEYMRDPRKDSGTRPQTYFDEKADTVHWDMLATHQENLQREAQAEEMRLLYVALTRAKYQVAMTLPRCFGDKKITGQSKKMAWNALVYLLQKQAGTAEDPSEPMVNVALDSLLNAWLEYSQVLQLDDAEPFLAQAPLRVKTAPTTEQTLQAAEFNQRIEQHWESLSFSKIKRRHDQAIFHLNEQELTGERFPFSSKDSAQEWGLTTNTLWETPEIEKETQNIADYYPNASLGASPMTWAGGDKVGSALHYFLEKQDFHELATLLPLPFAELPLPLQQSLQKLAHQMGLRDETLLDVNLDALQRWLQFIVNTPLWENSPFCLGELPAKQYLKEMEFYFRINHAFTGEDFSVILQKFGYLTDSKQKMQLRRYQGLMQGSIDLVFPYQAQWFVLDYKSNRLGEHFAAYDKEKLPAVMQEHHYDWQFLIYSVALHRYLAQRLPNYDYDRHFGGVVYAFMRGMNGKAGSGIYFHKPARAVIESLDALFD